LPGLELKEVTGSLGLVKFDITLFIADDGRNIHCSMRYDSDLFEAFTIQRMARYLQNILEQVCNDPSRRLSDISLIDQLEADELAAAFGGELDLMET